MTVATRGSLAGNMLERIGELLVVEVAQHHLGALLMQRARDAQADAAGATGDVGDLVLHIRDGRRLRCAHVGNGACAGGAALGGPRFTRGELAQARGAGAATAPPRIWRRFRFFSSIVLLLIY